MNWIDTAPIYGTGHAEEVVGRALKGMSQKPLIATKALFMWKPDKTTILVRLDRERVRQQCELSMQRLGVDFIDMYMIHWPDPWVYVEEAWETLAELKKEGKVGCIGVSNFSTEQMEMVKSVHHIAFLEPPYSMLERGAENGLLDYCGKNNIGVVTYSSLQQGLLAGPVRLISTNLPRGMCGAPVLIIKSRNTHQSKARTRISRPGETVRAYGRATGYRLEPA